MSGSINKLGRPSQRSPPPEAGEQDFVETEGGHVADPIRVVDERCAIRDDGVVDRVSITPEFGRDFVHAAGTAANLGGDPPAGTIRHRQPGRRDPGRFFGPRPDPTPGVWASPSAPAPHQPCRPTETHQVGQLDHRPVLGPRTRAATLTERYGRSRSTCRRIGPVRPAEMPVIVTAGKPTRSANMRVGSTSTRALRILLASRTVRIAEPSYASADPYTPAEIRRAVNPDRPSPFPPPEIM